MVDEDQRIIYWNQAAQEILGYEPDEVMGRNCYEILSGCDDEGREICCPQCYVSLAALAGNAVTNYDVAARTKSGKIRWINVSILTSPATQNNSVPLIVHLFRDATQEKRQERFIRQTLDAAKRLERNNPSTTTPLMPKESLADDLTDREREVLSLLAQGLSTQDIAQSLSISSATVRNHVQNILNKLRVHSRLEAVAYAFEHGVITLE